MINGISIPLLSPFRFYPATAFTEDGFNYQSVDNTAQISQVWQGVYPIAWTQPVCRYWYDLSPGIDFQIYHDDSIARTDIKAAIIDLTGTIIQELTVDLWWPFDPPGNTVNQLRIYGDLLSVDDGCYRIKIYEDGADDIYISEIISIKDTHEDCYPLQYYNFENDFGIVFDNSEDWIGKILVPLRMYKPVSKEERDSFNDDTGNLTTLRTVPKRFYEIETYPIPTWFAEKLRFIFGCSDLQMSKMNVNVESAPEINPLSESDMMEMTGELQLIDFNTDYFQEENIDTVSELLTSWAESGGTFTAFETDGTDITYLQTTTAASADSNTFTIVNGDIYLIDITIDTTVNQPFQEESPFTSATVTFDGTAYDLAKGRNVFLVEATHSGSTYKLELDIASGDNYGVIASVKHID